jgi:DNA helicase-2/ATP-dependent DNA helicase PcrA
MQLNFNKQQIEAIEHFKGACAVIAGAGSGKSTVLTNRIHNLVENHNVSQSDILSISFTNNTSKDLQKKLSKLGLVNLTVGTFHKICQIIFYQNNINITTDNLIKEWQIKEPFKGLDLNLKDIMSFIGYQKAYMKSYNDEFEKKESKYDEKSLRKYYKMYEDYKTKNNLYDLDDWLIKCLEILRVNPKNYEFILVDEHQDTNLVQNLILKELCKSGNIFCVFDFRQAIYTFRGGNPEYCMNFKKIWGENSKVINLDTNYRSDNNIVNKANGFIKQYYGDYEFYSDSIADKNENGMISELFNIDRTDEANNTINRIEELIKLGEDPNEICILYRLNHHSGNVENELRKRKINYDITNDSSFFKIKEVALIINYLKIILDQNESDAFETILKAREYNNLMISNKILKEMNEMSIKTNESLYSIFKKYGNLPDWQRNKFNQYAKIIESLKNKYAKSNNIQQLVDSIVQVFNLEQMITENYKDDGEIEKKLESINILKSFINTDNIGQFLKYIQNAETKKKKRDGVKLMTIHASKGLEFKHVFLIGIEDGKFPHKKSNLLDEARLFYVAITRPKENLYLSSIFKSKFIDEYMNFNKLKIS